MLMRVFRVILIFLVLYHSIYSEYNKIYCIFISAGKNEWNAILNGLEKSWGLIPILLNKSLVLIFLIR